MTKENKRKYLILLCYLYNKHGFKWFANDNEQSKQFKLENIIINLVDRSDDEYEEYHQIVNQFIDNFNY